ncbi:hypothetical protein HF521_021522 [Silurus meridionalis]|uniref:Domain of unknown function with conserved HDNR motif domain-containing protein n=1 Tax=Silurus meridionalis TaxID=175797 RepID=A0A8T0BG89_SILME|nr:hypothetical protein HF521_021522 [Silurus meridionalis]
MEQDGKWFAHDGSQQSELTRETCTTTGAMLSQAIPQHLQGQKRYPKTLLKHEKNIVEGRYTYSKHDNRAALEDNIETYDHMDFLPQQSTESTEGTQNRRRFPKNHLEQSRQAAMAQDEEQFMWFGRHDLNQRTPLSVLAESNLSLGSKLT